MENKMYQSLSKIKERYKNLSLKAEQEEVIKDLNQYRKLQRELNSISEIVLSFDKYLAAEKNLKEAKELLSLPNDEEIHNLAKLEIQESSQLLEKILEELKVLLLPKDENDDLDVIVEIRGAAGGDEANIFAGDLFNIYRKWCAHKDYKLKILEKQYGTSSGFSLLSFSVKGEKVFAHMKFESGVHRVQRVPVTETQGRVHTSTVTVTVLPDVSDEIHVEINPNDLKIDTLRSSGAGGQSVNTTDSAVRITHLPTGLVTSSQEERSQIANKDTAMKVLKAKLYDLERQKKLAKESGFRKLAGSGDRSEKIRTYNYPQDRVTDHRISLSVSLKGVISGKLDTLIDSLQAKEKEEKTKEAQY